METWLLRFGIKIFLLWLFLGNFGCQRNGGQDQLKSLQGNLELFRQIPVTANKIQVVETTDNKILFVLNNSFGLYGLAEDGSFLWSLAGIKILQMEFDKTDYLLGIPMNYPWNEEKQFYLIDINRGLITDQIKIAMEKGEGVEKIIILGFHVFVQTAQLNKHGLFKTFLLFDIQNGKLVFRKKLLIPVFMIVNEIKDKIFLINTLGSCNVAYPYQGISDFESGVYLVSPNTGLVLSRVMSAGGGFVSSALSTQDSLVYASFYSNIYNPSRFLELLVLKITDLKIVKRKRFPFRVGGFSFLKNRQNGLRIAALNNEDGKLYFFNDSLQIITSFPIYPSHIKYPVEREEEKYRIVRNSYLKAGNLDDDPGDELIIRKRIYKVPFDPKVGILEDRRGRDAVVDEFFIIDDNFKLLNVYKIENSNYNSRFTIFPERKYLIYTSKDKIKIFKIK